MGHYDIAVELLKHHETVDVNHQNAHGSTALLWAVDWGHEDIVKLLSQHDTLDVNLKNEDGDTARSLASIAGRKDIVKLLKHVKTNVDQESKKFKRAADLAKDNGPEEIVKCLTEHVQSCSPCEEKETQEVDAEPTPVHDVNNMETLLIKAAQDGQLEEVQNLLKKGANINALDKGCDTALIWVCYMGHYDIAVELLKHHETVDVNHQNAHGSTALLWAVDRGHEDIVKLIVATRQVGR
jgi:ankyrin repeat protein